MAKVLISNVIGAAHGSALDGLISAEIEVTTIEKEFQSDGEATAFDPVDVRVIGTATFENASVFTQALSGVEANLTATSRTKGGAGTSVTTVKNVLFTGAKIALPSLQAREGGKFTCQLRGSPGPTDTASSMVTQAAGV